MKLSSLKKKNLTKLKISLKLSGFMNLHRNSMYWLGKGTLRFSGLPIASRETKGWDMAVMTPHSCRNKLLSDFQRFI